MNLRAHHHHGRPGPAALRASRTAVQAAVLGAALVASAAGFVGAPGTEAGFTSSVTDTANTFASGDVLLSSTVGGTNCTSSGTTISSNSANCTTNPAPTGTLPAAGTTTAKSWTLASPGTLLSGVTTKATTCGAQAVADSAGSNTGVVHNTVAYGQTGPFSTAGAAMSFTQSSGAYVSTTQAVAGPQSFSIVAEVLWPSNTSTGTLVSFGSAPDTTVGTVDRALWVTGRRIYWGVGAGASTVVGASSNLTANAWHLVVATIGPSGMSLYVDGTQVGTNAGTTKAASYLGYWHLGWGAQSGWTSGPSNSFLAGSLADVAIIPTQLTAANVTTLKNATTNAGLQTAIASFSPTAEWDLDDPSTTSYGGAIPGTSRTLADSSGASNTGTGTAGTTPGVPGPLGGSAVSFDGTSGQATTTTQLTNPATFSLSAWFKTSASGFIVQFSNSQSGTPTNWDRQIWVDPTGHVVFGVWNTPEVTLTSPATYADGTWHMVVASIGAGGMKLYLDGSLVASNTTTTPQVFNGYWRIGWGNTATWADMPASGYFNGSIGHVAVYARQLTNTEAGSLWGLGSASAYDTAVIALTPQFYWAMDEVALAACSMVELTIGVVTGGSSACVLPVQAGSACPLPSTAVTLTSWTGSGIVVPGLAARGTQTVTVTLARGSVSATAAGIHVAGTVSFAASAGGFTATLIHPFGTVDL